MARKADHSTLAERLLQIHLSNFLIAGYIIGSFEILPGFTPDEISEPTPSWSQTA
jgi:hypothetical protein